MAEKKKSKTKEDISDLISSLDSLITNLKGDEKPEPVEKNEAPPLSAIEELIKDTKVKMAVAPVAEQPTDALPVVETEPFVEPVPEKVIDIGEPESNVPEISELGAEGAKEAPAGEEGAAEEDEGAEVIEEVTFQCEVCGFSMDVDEPSCPNCGTVFLDEAQSAELEAPRPGAEQVPAKARTQKVGKLEPATEMPVIEEPGARPVEFETAPEGLKSAIDVKHEKARVPHRGFVNGNGFVNGRGLVNGNGFVNGRGLVNGNGVVDRLTDDDFDSVLQRRQKSRRTGKVLAVVIAVAALIFVTPMAAMFLVHTNAGMAVDGDFSDWSDRVVYDDGTEPSIQSSLDISRYSLAVSGGSIYLFVQVAGEMLSGRSTANGVDTVNVYLDSDDNAETGYSIRGMGADRRLEVFGWDGIVRGSGLYQFAQGRDRADWNGWSLNGGLASATDGGKLEIAVASVDAGIRGSESFHALFQTINYASGKQDFAKALIGPSAGALVAGQTPAEQSILPMGTAQALVLTIDLEAKGRDVPLKGITLTRTGNAMDSDTGTITIKSGGSSLATGTFSGGTGKLSLPMDRSVSKFGSVRLEVYVDIPTGAVPERTFGLKLADNNALTVAAETPSLSNQLSSMRYIGAAPASIKIDGAFGDWSGIAANPDPLGDTPTSSTDIMDYRSAKTNGSVAFFVNVEDNILEGMTAPAAKMVRPGPPGPGGSGTPGPVTPLPELVGVDTVKVLIDSDNLALTGSPVNGLTFGADFALVVTGIGGTIRSKELYAWGPATRTWQRMGTFEAANDIARMEIAAPFSALGLTANSTFSVCFVAADWVGSEDVSDNRIVMVDPLQLTSDGDICHSSDGNTWNWKVDIGTKTFADMCVNTSSGYVYVIANDGAVYESTGDWTSWTEIVAATSHTDIVAIATDSGTPRTLYCLHSDGVINNTISGTWNASNGDVGPQTDYADMCYVSGSGGAATLYVIRTATGARVRSTTDSGTSWANFGNKNVGDDGNSETNVAICYGSAWSANRVFILQSDGEVRNDTDGTSANPWYRLENSSAAGTYVDMAYASSGVLWTVTSGGQTYTLTSDGNAGQGTWSTLGTSSESNVVAIAVGEMIPEFQDILLPLGGIIALFMVMRRRRTRKGKGN